MGFKIICFSVGYLFMSVYKYTTRKSLVAVLGIDFLVANSF